VQNGDANEKLTWRSRRLRRKVLWATLSIGFLCYAFFTWVLWPVKVVGESMMPNYRSGSRHFINKLAYLSNSPQRGDVVAVRNDGEVYLKRIVGLPGETVSFEGGVLHINGRRVPEPYTDARIPPKWRPALRLDPDEYFVIGDNRGVSAYTPVDAAQIIGKVLF